MLKDVNVLGAGDTFASCFLHKLLQNEGDIHNWIEFAHLKTTEIIRIQYETKYPCPYGRTWERFIKEGSRFPSS